MLLGGHGGTAWAARIGHARGRLWLTVLCLRGMGTPDPSQRPQGSMDIEMFRGRGMHRPPGWEVGGVGGMA